MLPSTSNSNQIGKQTIPLKIYWHEGMLLSQHLFQQNDLRNFQILARKLSLISHYNWGVNTIDIDKNALSNGLFRLNEIEVVFQDGLYLQYVANTQHGVKSLELKLNEVADTEVAIYIAVTASSNQISPLSGNNPRFYAIDGSTVSDENLVGNDTIVPRLVPNAFLCHDIPEGCIGFPIAKILHDEGNLSVLEFTPPCFYIAKNSFIWKCCSELVTSLRDKLNILCKNAVSNENVMPFDVRQMLTQLTIAVTSLEAIMFSDDVKPYELFKELARILGGFLSICNVSTDVLPAISPYNHNDINSCILPIIDLINKYTSTIGKGYTVLPFNKREKFFYRYISKQNIEDAKNKKFYIGIQSTNLADFSSISTWIKNAVIVSDFALDNVRLKRTPGATRREVSSDVLTKITPGSNAMLFEIEIDPHYIKAEQNLHVFNPGSDAKFQPKSIVLYLPQHDDEVK